MYQPYPSGGQAPEPSRPTPPRPVRTAVMLMYAGAGLSAVSLIVSVLSLHAIEKIIRDSSTTLTQTQVHRLAVATVTIAVVESVIAIGLWLLMAWANKAGQSWGRITATVLFTVNTGLLVLSLARGAVSLSWAFELLVWLIGLGAIVLLWRKEASEYFAAMSPRR
jgi:hypothetical protein